MMPFALRAATSSAALLLTIGTAPAPDPVAVPVTTAPSIAGPQSGRLIVFAKRIEKGAKPETTIDFSPFNPTDATIAAREVTSLTAGKVALIDAETDAYPAALSTLAPGTYRMQAVLDRNHDYTYGGRGAGDLESPVVEVTLPGAIPALTLDHVVPERAARPNDPLAAEMTQVRPVTFQSTAMTAFRGQPTFINGWIALPPGYEGGRGRYPVVYSDGGFGSSLASARRSAAIATQGMAKGDLPPMIWVYLDHSGPTGTHEFADSANNGPWGRALTSELIPALEKQYRMDGRASGRFLTGHSSGGWSTLWLQVRYPKVFGGSWPTSPDPADFHDFTNVDLYAPNANFYAGPDGVDRPLVRDKGKVVATMRQFARSEAVLGEYGGQIASFEWVFSPRGANGRPVPVFDRATGAVDPAVVTYWRDNYDVAHIVARDWKTLKPDLDGKIHLIVGTADTFYLDGPARRLKAVLEGLDAKAPFRFIDGRTHFDLFRTANDPMGLAKDIAWEMYAIARPTAKRPDPRAS